MSVYVIHSSGDVVSFDEFKSRFLNAKSKVDIAVAIEVAESGPPLEIDFNGQIPDPDEVAKHLCLQKATIGGKFKASPEEVEDVVRDLKRYSKLGYSETAYAVLSMCVRLKNADGKSGEINIDIPVGFSESIMVAVRKIDPELAADFLNAVTCHIGAFRWVLTEGELNCTSDGAPARKLSHELFDCPVTQSADVSLEKLVDAAISRGATVKEWMFAAFNEMRFGGLRDEEVRHLWKGMREVMTIPSKGSIDVQFGVSSIEGLEFVRSQLKGKKKTEATLGQFSFGGKYRANLVVSITAEGYEFLIESRDECEDHFSAIGDALGVKFKMSKVR